MTHRQTIILQVLLLLALTTAVYAGVRHHFFVWDTIPFVIENPWIHEWSIENLVSMFTRAHHANWHPIVLLSHALDFTLFGDDSGDHHLTNLVIHIANGLLLFYFLFRLLSLAEMSEQRSIWTAFIAALLFAIHPQHVESVAWVVERKDVLYSLFALCCFISYVNLRTESEPTFLHRATPFLFFLLSVGAKPMAVTLPVVLIMVDIYPLRRFSWATMTNLVIEKWHYVIVSLLVVIVTLNTQSMAMPDPLSLPLWAKIVNAIDNTWFYVGHYLWPLNLSPYYPYPQDATYLASAGFWWKGVLFLASMSAVTIALSLRGTIWPLLLFGFYLVTLLPVSGLIHVGPAKATDHYVYLATIPFSLITALLITTLYTRFSQARLIVIVLSSSYFLFLGLIAHNQVSVWNNPLSLWTRVVALHPESPFGHRNIAGAYARTGDWQSALTHAELSLKLGSPDKDFVIQIRQLAESVEEAR